MVLNSMAGAGAGTDTTLKELNVTISKESGI